MLLYVECKNWQAKVGVDIIRELSYIMSYKGNTTTILVARNNVTSSGYKEINQQAVLGKYILVFTLRDLKKIKNIHMFVDMIKKKYRKLKESTPFSDLLKV